MPEIVLFCEDSFHERFVGALLARFERQYGVPVRSTFRSAVGGLPRMHAEFKQFLRDLGRARQSPPDSIVVVLDANCIGYNARKESVRVLESHPGFQGLVSYCIPDPHIERWMLADARAFRSVFGRGCAVPALKCAKDEYKKLLLKEIRMCGIEPPLGGEEYAEDIVQAMDLAQMETREPSLGLFLKTLKALFNGWKSP